MQIGVFVHISVQVSMLLAVLVVPPTRLYLVSIDEQVSPATELYVDLHGGGLYGPSGTQMGVAVRILLQSKNWFACLIVPLTRLYFLSSVSHVSPATEVYVDKHGGVGVGSWPGQRHKS